VASVEFEATSLDDVELIRAVVASGRQDNFKKRWIEFDCQNGVHHGKYAEYKDGKRIRTKGGYIGRFDLVTKTGDYGKRRVKEFPFTHNCHYPERFQSDLDECGIGGIAVEGWPSGGRVGRLSNSGRPSGSQEHGI